ncbi:hypothetical protein SAMN05660359_03682 [Geodermatophilus obscurus]|uniref:Uncharacterized protein n=1 Tax=Geodermatophilus obscurus TaxID=1861 RepID=A0A1I5HFP0_9ACTN|nr:hypothetical protein SAMN05660359_03682 [Geodermatophilus obscurus]
MPPRRHGVGGSAALLLGHSREARGRCPLATPAPDGWMAARRQDEDQDREGTGRHPGDLRARELARQPPDPAHGRPGLLSRWTALPGFAPRRCRASRCASSPAAPGVLPARMPDPAVGGGVAQRCSPDDLPPWRSGWRTCWRPSGGTCEPPSRRRGPSSSTAGRCGTPAEGPDRLPGPNTTWLRCGVDADATATGRLLTSGSRQPPGPMTCRGRSCTPPSRSRTVGHGPAADPSGGRCRRVVLERRAVHRSTEGSAGDPDDPDDLLGAPDGDSSPDDGSARDHVGGSHGISQGNRRVTWRRRLLPA